MRSFYTTFAAANGLSAIFMFTFNDPISFWIGVGNIISGTYCAIKAINSDE